MIEKINKKFSFLKNLKKINILIFLLFLLFTFSNSAIALDLIGNPTPPSISSPTVTAIITTGATLGATLTALGTDEIGEVYTEVGTCWATTSNPTINCLPYGYLDVPQTFTHARTGMPSSTLIYYRGYADDGNHARVYTSSFSFTTTSSNVVPTVTSPTSASITTTSATLGATVTSLGSPASISSRGICWGTTSNPTANCLAQGGTTTGTYTQSMTLLSCGTLYYYRGYAQNTTGRGYSADGTFTTTVCNSVPTVTSPTSATITQTSATLGYNLTSLGIPAYVSAHGVCWGTTTNPTTNCNLISVNPPTGVKGVSTPGFSCGTFYYYRGYATNTTGTGYSADGTFTTSACPLASCSSPCGTIASGATCTAYSSTSATSPTTCASQVRTCTNGSLSGTYTAASCVQLYRATWDSNLGTPDHGGSDYQSSGTVPAKTVTRAGYTFSAWSPALPSTMGTSNKTYVAQWTAVAADCTGTPWGTMTSGTSNTAYASSLPAGSCTGQTRTCTNGTLSGSYTATSCTAGCNVAPWGAMTSGTSQTAYSTATVPYGSTCASQTRTCTSGAFSGTYAYASCTVDAAASCTGTPWGTVASGYSNTAYSTQYTSTTCTGQTRTCTNGSMSGTYLYPSCSNATTPPAVNSPTVSSVGTTSATLGATVTTFGTTWDAYDVSTGVRGTCWGTTTSPTTNCVAASGTSTGAFSHSRTGMPSSTLIYYRGYATGESTSYSATSSFTTGVATAVPTVTSPTSASIAQTSATLGANVTSLGNPAAISARGTCWGTTNDPTTNCLANGTTTTGIYTHSRTGLSCGTFYYYRGYADNTTGRGYSASSSFTTSACNSIPTVTSPTGTSAAQTTATLGANVTSLGIPAAISARGTCWGTTSSPSINCLANGTTTTGIFTQARTGLTCGSTIYYRGYATNTTGTAFSADGTVTTTACNSVPSLVSPTSASITTATATLGATVTSLGTPAVISSRGVVYGLTSSPTGNATAATGTTTGLYTVNISGLACNTLYYYRGYAVNTTGTGYSSQGTFTTSICASIPSLSTPTVSAITASSATLGANLISLGNPASILERGTCWATTPAPTINCLNDFGTTTGAYTQSRTGLPASSTIYYRGYAVNDAGTGFSADGIFTTSSANSVPTLISPTSASITETSATLGANITSAGVPATLTASGICVGTTINPSIGPGCVSSGTTTGIFTVPVYGLSASTLYYYRGYAINATGTAYSVSGSFTTAGNAVPTVSSPSAGYISTDGAILTANVTSLGTPASITARGTCWGTTTNPSTNCVAEGGASTGSFSQHRGGMSPSTLYYFRGYATNSSGTGYSATSSFNTIAAAGADSTVVYVNNKASDSFVGSGSVNVTWLYNFDSPASCVCSYNDTPGCTPGVGSCLSCGSGKGVLGKNNLVTPYNTPDVSASGLFPASTITASKTFYVKCTKPGTAGACGTARNSCTEGTPNDIAVNDDSNYYRWRCEGVDGGANNDTCNYPRPTVLYSDRAASHLATNPKDYYGMSICLSDSGAFTHWLYTQSGTSVAIGTQIYTAGNLVDNPKAIAPGLYSGGTGFTSPEKLKWLKSPTDNKIWEVNPDTGVIVSWWGSCP